MKIAVFLWGKAKNTEQEKRYNRRLLVIYEREISKYLKNSKNKKVHSKVGIKIALQWTATLFAF